MKTIRLTRLQLILVVLFGLAALTGPWLVQNTDALILVVMFLGVAIGGVTFWIGWLTSVKKYALEYPFEAWSIAVMKPFLSPKQLHTLQKKQHPITGRMASIVGTASLVLGGAVVIGLIAALVYVYL